VFGITDSAALQRYIQAGRPTDPVQAVRSRRRIMRDRRDASRRDFLKNCIAGAFGLAAADNSLPLDTAEWITPTAGSKVVAARDAQLRGSPAGGSVDAGRVSQLLDRAMQTLFNSDDPSRAWNRIVRPGQRVGLKVNTLGGRGISTNVQLVEAVCRSLQGAGVPAQNIVIFDRDSREMERAGFSIRTGGAQVQCFGSDRVGFESDLSEYGSVGSQLSKILTRHCDVLINMPVLKDHDGAGVTIALKNMYGVIHNPNKYHPNGCNPFVADVNMLPGIRSKVRLHICDATSACYEGGPAFKPEFTWHANTLMLSQDPVALDYSGWQFIERKRAEKGLKTLEADGRPPRYIATAADSEHRLGTNDPKRIDVKEVRNAD
jgi:uncharacterized protein (DUF362 family)